MKPVPVVNSFGDTIYPINYIKNSFTADSFINAEDAFGLVVAAMGQKATFLKTSSRVVNVNDAILPAQACAIGSAANGLSFWNLNPMQG